MLSELQGSMAGDGLIAGLRRLTYASPVYGYTLLGRAPSRLLGTPPEVVPGNAAAGQAILAGHLTHAGLRHPIAVPPDHQSDADEAWLTYYHSFAWLSDLRRVGTDQARDFARGLIDIRQVGMPVGGARRRANGDEYGVRIFYGIGNFLVGKYDKKTIRAPFSGVVVAKSAQPGEMISPVSAGGGFTRTGICTIVDMTSLEIEVDVNEAFIGRVHPGQRVDAVLDAYPDWTIPASVIAIVPTANRDKATVKVRIALHAKDPRILPDMAVKTTFLEDTAAAGDRAPAPSAPMP